MNSNWSYSPETPNLGQIRRFLEPCDLEIWRMTLKNNRAPLLSIIKLYASSHHHMWIQTGVTVRKRWSWVVTSVTLTFDLWPWPFAWTSLLSLVITPENFMMIGWWEHSQKGVTDRRTDRQTDGRTDWTIHRAAWSQLKKGVFYWASKSAISVEKGVFFSSKIREKGVFFKLGYERGIRGLVGSRGAGNLSCIRMKMWQT